MSTFLPPSPLRRPRRVAARGVTLIELMIAVAVVAILASIAYPAYQDQVRKSRRSAAQAVMMEVAQKQMQIFLDRRSYAAATNTAAIQGAPLRVAVDSAVSSYYDLSVTVTTPSNAPPTFTVTAAPKGAQASDKCGTMTIDQVNAKTPATGCW